MLFLCLVFLTSTNALPVSLNESENEIDNLDNDTIHNLHQLEDEMFGSSRNSVGDKVAKWTPNSGVFPEELGDYIEGDIRLPISFARNGVKSWSSMWPKRVIPYQICSRIKLNDRLMILNAIQKFHNISCLKFRRRSSDDVDYVKFKNRRNGCWSSSIGRSGGVQIINLQSPACMHNGTIIHEILHAVGFFHEQSRPDRDEFVTINYNNIEWGKEWNFRKIPVETVNTFGIEYDYRSVMHYSARAFSKNGKPTIEPKVKGTKLGPRNGFSKKDVQKLRKMYSCDVQWTW